MNFGMNNFQGGGGYTNNDNGGGGGGSGSQDSNKRRNYDDQTLIPITLQMAMTARQDHSGGADCLVLEDGRPISLVKVVGAVRSFEEQSTNVLYKIEDGTGIMELKQWVDDNDCTALSDIKKSTLQENIYIKAIGQIKEYNNEKMIVASMVRPLTTGNELTHHMLEVAYSAEKSKRANSIVAPVGAANNNNNMMMGMGGGGTGMMSGPAGGSDISQSILNFLKENDQGETGVNIEECIRSMPNHTEAEIRQVVSMLAEEGHVYSTISENHYKIAM